MARKEKEHETMHSEHSLTTYIIENNLTNRILAKRLGVTENYLSMVRHGHRLPSPKLVERVCRMLKREQKDLFPGYEEMRRKSLKRHRRKR